MKRVIYDDGTGLLRCALIRDFDDESNPSVGLPMELPPLNKILSEAVTDLNNELVQRGLFSIRDIERNEGALTGAILSAIRTKIIMAYKLKEQKHGSE
jgi:hypothetical protein